MPEYLNEPRLPMEERCGDFPTAEHVEEASKVELVPDVESLTEEQQQKEDVETAMKRWVEQVESVRMLDNIDWLEKVPNTAQNVEALNQIFSQGMTYCTHFLDSCLQPWKMDRWPLNPQLWLGEMGRCLRAMKRRNMIPYWLKRPHDRNIRDDAGASADGSTDPGNYVLDMVVHALRLWQYTEAQCINMVIRQSSVDYGEKANKSSHGPVNLRGNIVEAMQRNLQLMGSQLLSHEQEYDALEYWWKWEMEVQLRWQRGRFASSSIRGDSSASASSSAVQWSGRRA